MVGRLGLGESVAPMLDALHGAPLTIPPNQMFIEAGRDGESMLVLAGWAYSFRLLRDGRRQILAFHLPGDAVNANGLFGTPSGASVRSLTAVTATPVDGAAWTRLAHEQPELARHLAWELGRAPTLTEHIVSLGRRDARERLAYLLVILWRRLSLVGLTREWVFDLPVKQEHLADHLGLSVVHVSRVLGQLRRDGLVRVERGIAAILDPARLTEIAELSPDDAAGPATAEPQMALT